MEKKVKRNSPRSFLPFLIQEEKGKKVLRFHKGVYSQSVIQKLADEHTAAFRIQSEEEYWKLILTRSSWEDISYWYNYVLYLHR